MQKWHVDDFAVWYSGCLTSHLWQGTFSLWPWLSSRGSQSECHFQHYSIFIILLLRGKMSNFFFELFHYVKPVDWGVEHYEINGQLLKWLHGAQESASPRWHLEGIVEIWVAIQSSSLHTRAWRSSNNLWPGNCTKQAVLNFSPAVIDHSLSVALRAPVY